MLRAGSCLVCKLPGGWDMSSERYAGFSPVVYNYGLWKQSPGLQQCSATPQLCDQSMTELLRRFISYICKKEVIIFCRVGVRIKRDKEKKEAHSNCSLNGIYYFEK